MFLELWFSKPGTPRRMAVNEDLAGPEGTAGATATQQERVPCQDGALGAESWALGKLVKRRAVKTTGACKSELPQ